MQGDLISRSALIEVLKAEQKQDRSRAYGDHECDLIAGTIAMCIDFVKAIPIAYDVEKVVEEMNKLLNEELHSVLKPLPDGTEYPEEAYKLLYLNTRLRGLIRNGGKE